MTGVEDLLDQLKSAGIRLAVEGDRLSVSAPKGAITDALRAELVRRKVELITRLREDHVSAASRSAPGPGPSPIAAPAPALGRSARSEEMPVSHAQRRMWFLKQLDPSSTAYHVPSAFRLSGPLDVPALEQSLSDLVMRHESLRMSFVTVDDEPRCRVAAEGRADVEHHDLSRLPAELRESEAMRLVVATARKPFDIARSPLLHAALIRLAPDVHVLCFVFDHIVSDGLSVAIFVGELRLLYAARVGRKEAGLPDLALAYPDYVDWQRRALAEGALEQQLGFWKEQLAGLPAALQIPTDRPRPRFRSDRGAMWAHKLPLELSEQVKAFARREGATLYMALLAAYQALLHRYTGVDDFTVGTAVANRSQPETERMFGLFANNIVLRADLSGNPTVRELIERVRARSTRAYAHQDMPFDVLVEALAPQRDGDNPPVFQTMFTLHTLLVMSFDLADVQCRAVEFQAGTARFDLSVDVFELSDGLRICFEYNTDLFEEATIRRMVANYTNLLQGFMATPELPVRKLPLPAPAERRLVIDSFNDTAAETEAQAASGLFLPQFDRHAGHSPDAVAVSFEGRDLTYAQLHRQSGMVARYLAGKGIGRNAVVAICVERSLELIVALIGIQKSGAAYLPLDPGFPADRLSYMLSDSGAAVLLRGGGAGHGVDLPPEMKAVDLESVLQSVEEGAPADLPSCPAPADAAYLLYTSGSTGRPKGVVVSHGSLANFLGSMRHRPGLSAGDVLAAVTTVSFDISGLEIYLPLSVGSRVELVSSEVSTDGPALATHLAASGATVMQATPATWRLLIEADWRGGTGFKALCGGEALPADLAHALLDRVGELWNLYGPTETTIWSTCEKIERDAEITIGRPIANTRVYVLDPDGSPLPVGVTGELWIGGAGVAAGYHRRPELTAERFRVDPYAPQPGGRMYRTGDLARWRSDGRLEHLGRLDHQVKIRGFRIELGEIEAALAALPEVRQAVAGAVNVAAGDSRLVAYLSYRDGDELTSSEVRRRLRRSLPDYMIPSVVLEVSSIPLTPNGKVDRMALPNPFLDAMQEAVADDPPAPGMEQLLAQLWRDILKVDRITANDNFFDLGGHSLLSIRVASAVQRATGWRMDPRTLFFQSLREIAAVAPVHAAAPGGQAS